MNSYHFAQSVADRAGEKMRALRQADRDVAQCCDGMAFDGEDAETVYRKALDYAGVPLRETAGLSATALRVLLRSVRASQASRSAPAIAMDEVSSALSSILAGIEAPRDLSTRSDRLR